MAKSLLALALLGWLAVGCQDPKTVLLVNASSKPVAVTVEGQTFKLAAYGQALFKSVWVLDSADYGPLEIESEGGRKREGWIESAEMKRRFIREDGVAVVVLQPYASPSPG